MDGSIGSLLRDMREARGWTLEDVERATRIRVKYLMALEADEFSAIPSAVQARGFLRNYAQHLGLNPDQVLSQFDASAKRAAAPVRSASPAASPPAGYEAPAPPTQTGRAAPVITPWTPPPSRTSSAAGRPGAVSSPQAPTVRRPRIFSADLLIGIVVVLALGVFFVWGGARLAGVLFSTAPQATPIPLGSASDTPTASPTSPAASATPTIPPLPQSLTEVPIMLAFEQTAWVRVTVDGEEVFSGLGMPGARQEYTGATSVEVLTGNGAGVRVIYAGRDQGVLGSFGEVVLRIYTLNGMLTATPSLTPEMTDTATPRPATDTPTPSATNTRAPGGEGVTPARTPTPRPSATLRPSDTPPPSPTSAP